MENSNKKPFRSFKKDNNRKSNFFNKDRFSRNNDRKPFRKDFSNNEHQHENSNEKKEYRSFDRNNDRKPFRKDFSNNEQHNENSNEKKEYRSFDRNNDRKPFRNDRYQNHSNNGERRNFRGNRPFNNSDRRFNNHSNERRNHERRGNGTGKDYSEIILDFVTKEDGRPIPSRVLLNKIIHDENKQGYIDNDDFYNSIDKLVETRKLRKLQSGSLVIPRNNAINDEDFDEKVKLTGIISINQAGNGFITVDEEKKSKYYVNKINLNNAQNGDKVEFIAAAKNEGENLIDAKILNIISHAKNYFVGEYCLDANKNGYVKLDDDKSSLKVIINNTSGLVEGNKIFIKIDKYEKNCAYGEVVKIIGHKYDVGVDILSIVLDNGVEPEFSEKVLKYAQDIKLDINENERKIRKDLTNKPIVTIDPATSKDFDDAFYCEKRGSDYLLSVQIADVSHYVKDNTDLNEEALKRGCSIYLVDRVVPMLPHNLSDDICSINPNVERMALGCDMIIDKNGKFKSIDVYPSIIKSWRRFNYDEVNEYIDKKTDFSKENNEVKESIDIALELTEILSEMKNKRGYIDFEIPEPIIKVDEKCVPTEIIKKTQGRAQKMIEDFMVAANEAVTIHAEKNKLPFIYRVHESPDADRIKTFELEAKRLKFKLDKVDIDKIEPGDISRWLENNNDNPNIDIIRMMLLRSMAKAKYDTENLGHFGLASINYTHFTSPIRRYPDLIVHRIFWNFLFTPNANEQTKIKSDLKYIADLSSKNELISIKCERDVNAMKFAEYMSFHLNETFSGVVTNINNFAVFVQLENLVEGMISLRNLDDDFYKFDRTTNSLVGRNKHRIINVGAKLSVKVIEANKESRKIEFKLIKFL